MFTNAALKNDFAGGVKRAFPTSHWLDTGKQQTGAVKVVSAYPAPHPCQFSSAKVPALRSVKKDDRKSENYDRHFVGERSTE